LLLPVDMREWLLDDDLVFVVAFGPGAPGRLGLHAGVAWGLSWCRGEVS